MALPVSDPIHNCEIVSSSSAVVAIINDDFLILDCSDHFAGFFELPKSLIIKREFTDFVVLREQAKANTMVQNALSGQPENTYLSFVTRGTKKKVGNISFLPLFENSVVTGVFCFIKDVSNKVAQNKNVFDSEQRLKAIFENEPECVKIVSLNGLLQDINPAGLNMLEANKKDVLGKEVLPVIHEQDRISYLKLHDETCKGKGGSLQFRIRGFKGTRRWLHTSTVPLRNKLGEVYSVLSVTRDITQQKEAEIKIQLSEKRFKNLVSNGSDIIVIINKEGIFQYISENVNTILGFSPADFVGKNAFDFIHPDDTAKVLAELNKVINQDNTALGITHRFLNNKGEWTWLESKGTNHLGDPSITGIVINARNIMDRIKLQERLNVEMANKQKQITAAIIQTQEKERSQLGLELHDNVSQVLTTIKLYNEMLLDGVGDHKDILGRSIRHLQECIDEIRSISKRLSAPTLGKICLNDSIEELVQSINLTNRVSIQYSKQGLESSKISQDLHLAIYRIIQEQLNNILKHSQATRVQINMINSGTRLELSITDNGRGFNVQQKNYGIGITNMTSRAEHMGGKFKLISEPGKGCSILVSFLCKSSGSTIKKNSASDVINII